MANEPSWDDIFRPADGAADQRTSASTATLPPGQGPIDRRPRKKKRRLGWLWALITVFVVLIAGGTVTWFAFEDKIRHVLGWEEPIDYTTAGDGQKVTVVIQSGDIGEDVARELQKAGVTKTFDAFYKLLLTNPDVTFEPGNYTLQKQMSAAAALAALQDPKNKIINQVTIPEGTTAAGALKLLSAGTGIPDADLVAAAKDFAGFGVPSNAPSIEGFLFPATYTFDPGVTAQDVVKRLVDEMFSRLDKAGVAPADRLKVLTLASIVQAESGPNKADMYKISRVFQNRLAQGIRLESDATVHYGIGSSNTVWTTGAQRSDTANKYNTYAHAGLPIGPIGLPGSDAIDAALHPAAGKWLFFVTVDLKKGTTVFSQNIAQHDAAVAQLRAWCRASTENAAYCS